MMSQRVLIIISCLYTVLRLSHRVSFLFPVRFQEHSLGPSPGPGLAQACQAPVISRGGRGASAQTPAKP